jgi:flavin reductase (DIM6/NTAB) family NADH-FMN oxidoreductase RutF
MFPGVAPDGPEKKARDHMPETSFTPGPETARAYREALGCFGTGVTIVTTLSEIGPLAMTANSFASLSLDPALVLWCPAKASLRHAAFAGAERFAIHVMAEDQQELALHFSRCGDKFGGVQWHPDVNGVPHLGGCLARFDCRRRDVHDGGDHSIIVGQVTRARHRAGQGLIFKRGQYGGFLGPD